MRTQQSTRTNEPPVGNTIINEKRSREDDQKKNKMPGDPAVSSKHISILVL